MGKQVAARYYEPFAIYCEAALVYLAICTLLTFLQSHLEKKLEWKQPDEAAADDGKKLAASSAAGK